MTTFGLGQIMSTTPTIVRRLRAAIIYMIAGSLAFVTILAPKFGLSGEDYAQWCGFIILGVKGVSMLFGVSDDEVVSEARAKIREINDKS